jgi:hypothetical protein
MEDEERLAGEEDEGCEFRRESGGVERSRQ